MKTIESNTIDLIYCDILYGTGRDFMDYKDLYPIKEIIYEHYEPRIKEMHRILKPTGSIYLQMDTRISHWVRCIMDNTFMYSNFLNEINWCYTMASNNKKKYAAKHDNIIFYSKSKKYIFNYDDIRIPYNKETLSRTNRKSGNNGLYKGVEAEEKHKNRLNNMGKIPEDYWIDINRIQGNGIEKNGYATQKPKSLIERIIKASSNEGDLVADFYAGSFTTAEVCKDLNRNFIGCDINPLAVDISKQRLA
jgi:DNA modification methylase